MGNAAYSSEALSARTLEKLAESLARERGWLMIRSDKKLNNQNGFQLVDLRTREVIAGARFELSALDILAITNKNQ